MKKTLLAFVLSMALVLSLTGCGTVPSAENETPAAEPQAPEAETEAQAANFMTAYRADGSTAILVDCGNGIWVDANGFPYELGEDGTLRAMGSVNLYTEVPSAVEPEIIRQDGDRYEGLIMLEGMEQTVPYEHIVNKTAGFEMDYDYETFVRHSEADRERFILAWDDPENPEYYLEVTYSPEDAETVAAAISEELSKDYEIHRSSFALDRAGSCILIGASEVKGGYTADQMQTVYIIPTDDGCLIATAHYGLDSADLFGVRFRAMVNTLSVIDR
jgi:predicted small lipoprotein YifL